MISNKEEQKKQNQVLKAYANAFENTDRQLNSTSKVASNGEKPKKRDSVMATMFNSKFEE